MRLQQSRYRGMKFLIVGAGGEGREGDNACLFSYLVQREPQMAVSTFPSLHSVCHKKLECRYSASSDDGGGH